MYEFKGYAPSPEVVDTLAGVPSDRRSETAYVVERMIGAGWPSPEGFAVGEGKTFEDGRREWATILVGLAIEYLKSCTLRVDVLVALGPCAASDLARALYLAGWEAG